MKCYLPAQSEDEEVDRGVFEATCGTTNVPSTAGEPWRRDGCHDGELAERATSHRLKATAQPRVSIASMTISVALPWQRARCSLPGCTASICPGHRVWLVTLPSSPPSRMSIVTSPERIRKNSSLPLWVCHLASAFCITRYRTLLPLTFSNSVLFQGPSDATSSGLVSAADTASCEVINCLPGRDRLVGEPDRQAPAPTQARVIRRPVGHLALLLRNMVATRSVGLERHDGIRIRTVDCVLSQPNPRHQSPIRATTPRADPITGCCWPNVDTI
jgi:hypothetical protein